MSLVSADRLTTLLAGLPTGRPAYRALAEGVRLLVVDGRLGHRTRLPGERDLARALGCSRTTVARAYGELVETGWALTRQGSGTTVLLPGTERGSATLAAFPGRPEPGSDVIDLTCAASPAPPGTQAAFERAMLTMPAQLSGHGYLPDGDPVLRERVAARYAERGLPTDPRQIIVVPGALSAAALLARAFLGAGDRALVESPTYPTAAEALRRGGVRTVGVPVGTDGWHVPTLAATLRQTAPRLALLIPDFQNPTGALMDTETRDGVCAALRATNTIGVADETMVDLSLDLDEDDMPPPLAAFDNRVVTIGSMSKSYWGGLRIGWVRAPFAVLDRIVEARASLDLGCAVVDQLAAAELLADRRAVLADRRTALRESRTALITGLGEHLPDWEFTVPAGGLTLWARLPHRLSSAIVLSAEPHGLLLASGGRFSVDGGLEAYVRLPFAIDAARMPEALRRLARAYEDALHRPEPVRQDSRQLIA